MRKIHLIISLFLFSIIGINCQKEISSGPGTVSPNTNPIAATLQGNIVDENGQPANGVKINVGIKTATTNARGYFRIENAPLDKKTSLVTAEKNGYFKAYRVFGATSGTNQVTIQLLKKTLAGTINSSSGGSVSLINGSKIELPVNGVVKRSGGGSYSGTVNVYATYIDPTSSAISEIVPGSFLATDKNNNKVLLASYGMLAVELESASGEKLQIATGQTATLTTAIPTSLQSSAPASIPLWFVDEQTGIWKEEGTATKNGSNYVGEVKHFSYWNCDIPGTTVNLTATFKDPDGLPLANTPVRVKPVTGYGQAYGMTDSYGQVSGPVPANMNLVLEVMTPCYSPAYSQNIGPFTGNVDLGTITATITSGMITVEGALTNCSGGAVTNGYALIIFNNSVRYADVNASGLYGCSFLTCNGMPPTCEVIGVDKATNQQGATMNIPVVSPVTNAGTVSACGSSSLEFINYDIDGVSHTISNTIQGDQFSSYNYDSTGATGTNISGISSSFVNIAFNFNNNRMPGIFPVDNLYVSSVGNVTLIQPFNITITNFPLTAGLFYEGNFTGQFTDGVGTNHTISCSFRVRRQ